MGLDLEFDCRDGRCTWRWDANVYPVDRLTLRIRHAEGGIELREVPNTGEVVLPDNDEVQEIVYRGGGRGRKRRWRGPAA